MIQQKIHNVRRYGEIKNKNATTFVFVRRHGAAGLKLKEYVKCDLLAAIPDCHPAA